jgi:hypothetical protein
MVFQTVEVLAFVRSAAGRSRAKMLSTRTTSPKCSCKKSILRPIMEHSAGNIIVGGRIPVSKFVEHDGWGR